MRNKIIIGVFALSLSAFAAGCTDTTSNMNGNANTASNANTATSTTINANSATVVGNPADTNATAPPTIVSGEYETTTKTDASGVKTETRVYKNNARISKVVITTRNGKQTARVTSASGEEKELNNHDDLGDLLSASGDKIADAAGFVKDKTVDAAKATGSGAKVVGEKTVEGGKTVIEKTGEGAKYVGGKTVDGAKVVGEKTADGAKTVGEKTVSGTKKVGSAIKHAVTP